MQKQAPTLGRLFVMVGFALSCFGLLLFLWLAFGGPIPFQPQGYQFKVNFPEATQLATEADVRISGVPVGKVKKIEPKGGLSQATIQLDTKYAPLPRTARDAQLRSLIQNANRVFQTTAQRNRELAETFVVLPTFEQQSQITLNRLDRFAHNTNPLITELRPAAQQLSPTLVALEQISPDLRRLFVNLGP